MNLITSLKNRYATVCIVVSVTIILLMLLSSCTTQVPLNVVRRPELDTASINKISVTPFTATNSSYQSVAQQATNAATQTIQQTGKFTLISSQTVQEAQRAGQASSYVDAIFNGNIDNIVASDIGQTTITIPKLGTSTTYWRDVEVTITYSLTRTRDGSLLGPVTKKSSLRGNASDPSSVPTVASLAGEIVSSLLGHGLVRSLVPYTARVNRTIETDKDKAVKPQMDAALAMVKSGSYKQALQAYLKIWESYQSVPAAINAAIMHEALSEPQAAADLMSTVYEATGSPRAKSSLDRINAEIAATEGVKQYAQEASENPTERVTNHAFNEIKNILPNGAKLWIQNNAQNNNRVMIEVVVNNLISSFLKANFEITDRDLIDSILKEQNFQVSGSVDDASIVNLGKLVGASHIVVVSTTGIGPERRLSVRVLDIATGTLKMQSDTGTDWKI